MLATVSALFSRLDGGGVRYCHWKSNWILAETLDGETDIDVLVHRADAQSLRAILQELGFRPAIELDVAPFPSVEHYHALDESGALVHVHAYYRVISGDSLAKNYHLPIEEMLLTNCERVAGVNVPSKGAETIVFVLRMSLKHATLTELALLLRSSGDVRREAAWLVTGEARAAAAALLPAWLPGFDQGLFGRALDALCRPAPLWRRVVLGRRVRAQLRPFARRGRLRAWVVATRTLVDRATYRLRGIRKGLAPASGGAVIAFVGAEASGKSTLLGETERWLGRHYTVRRVHAGKPPSTLLTAGPNVLLPALRRLVPGQRSTRVSAERHAGDAPAGASRPFPLLFGIRSVLLAHDRRVLLTRAFATAANGGIVLCDRYPSVETGAPDGAQLGGAHGPVAGGSLRRWLAAREARLYRDIPPPDLVLYLTAPLEVTLERNRLREKIEPEDYVLLRHTRSSNLRFDRVRVEMIDTTQPLEESARAIREIVWDAL